MFAQTTSKCKHSVTHFNVSESSQLSQVAVEKESLILHYTLGNVTVTKFEK